MRHYILYIPGLGDSYDGFRKFSIFFWRIFGVRTELIPMQWYDGKNYEDKLIRVERAIKRAQSKGYTVSLIGESAGGSMAMNVFAHDESLYRLISLCGVNSYKTPISPRIFQRGPAFKESVSILNDSQSIAIKTRVKRITVITALYDPTVPIKSNIVSGARRVTIWSIGHLTTIVLCLTIFSFVLVREVKREI